MTCPLTVFTSFATKLWRTTACTFVVCSSIVANCRNNKLKCYNETSFIYRLCSGTHSYKHTDIGLQIFIICPVSCIALNRLTFSIKKFLQEQWIKYQTDLVNSLLRDVCCIFRKSQVINYRSYMYIRLSNSRFVFIQDKCKNIVYHTS